jgi:hypothetical protein
MPADGPAVGLAVAAVAVAAGGGAGADPWQPPSVTSTATNVRPPQRDRFPLVITDLLAVTISWVHDAPQ